MKLIVGLGNPGPEHERTRHNVGFEVLDRLARRHAPGAPARSKFHGVLIDTSIDQERVMLFRPTTFMNRSGLAVAEAVRFYKLQFADALLIVVDDLALPCGAIRLRPGGSAGGHNGLTDIEQKLGSDEFGRLRIGIDGPGAVAQRDYVLGRFRPDQRELVEPALEDATNAAGCWATSGMTETMNRFNRKQTG